MLARCRSPWQWRTWPARRRCSSRSRRLASSSRQRAVRRTATLGPDDRLGQRREILGVALDHLAHSGVATVFAAHRRLGMERGDLRRQVVHDRGREPAARGDAIEEHLLIEPRHLEQPFDRLPGSGEGQAIAHLARVTGTKRRYSIGAVRARWRHSFPSTSPRSIGAASALDAETRAELVASSCRRARRPGTRARHEVVILAPPRRRAGHSCRPSLRNAITASCGSA